MHVPLSPASEICLAEGSTKDFMYVWRGMPAPDSDCAPSPHLLFIFFPSCSAASAAILVLGPGQFHWHLPPRAGSEIISLASGWSLPVHPPSAFRLLLLPRVAFFWRLKEKRTQHPPSAFRLLLSRVAFSLRLKENRTNTRSAHSAFFSHV